MVPGAVPQCPPDKVLFMEPLLDDDDAAIREIVEPREEGISKRLDRLLALDRRKRLAGLVKIIDDEEMCPETGHSSGLGGSPNLTTLCCHEMLGPVLSGLDLCAREEPLTGRMLDDCSSLIGELYRQLQP